MNIGDKIGNKIKAIKSDNIDLWFDIVEKNADRSLSGRGNEPLPQKFVRLIVYSNLPIK